MQIVFGKSSGIVGLLIRVFTWSRYNHVAIVDGKNVIEATAAGGVCVNSMASFRKRYKKVEFATISGDITKARKHIGKKYDFTGVIGIFFKRSWQDKDRWFCSELVAETTTLFRKQRISRVTPEHIYMISK